MTSDSSRAAWDSLLGDLVREQPDAVLSALRRFVPGHSDEQVVSWTRSLAVLQSEGTPKPLTGPSCTGRARLRHSTPTKAGTCYRSPQPYGFHPDRLFAMDYAGSAGPSEGNAVPSLS